LKATLPLPPKFSLRGTVRSHGYFCTLPFNWVDEAEVLERVDRLRAGGRPHIVRISARGEALEVEAVGARSIPRAYLGRVTRMLQLHVDLRPFYRAIRGQAHLRWVRRAGYGRILSCGDLFEDLVKAICGTNNQWSRAVIMADRISTLGPRLPRSDRCAFPSPAEVAQAGEAWLVDEARVGYRARAIHELATRAADGELDLEAWAEEAPRLPGPELRARFTSLRGIGPATAAYLAGFFGRFDAVNVDSAVLDYAARTYFDGDKPHPKEAAALFEPYGDWAGLVSWLEVWADWQRRAGRALP